ncbi:MAG TPA: HAD-IB family hydrolase [Candidatus Wallbacteria bacterium]|nr:HAD-IB family hydrolase [Candidatus Wallbacteria bacterium]
MSISCYNFFVMQKEKKKRLILLDIDDTLFRCDTFVAFIAFYLRTNPARAFMLPWILLLAVFFKLGAVSNVTLKQNALRLLKGETRADLADYAGRFLRRLFAGKLNFSVSEAIKKLAATGLYDIVVISASPSFYIETIGGRINALRTIATNIKFDEYDRLVPVLDGNNCKGEEKIVRLRREINLEDYDLKNSYAFSDSVTDLPMFELVGRPVAVTPDSKLMALALDKKYIIIK